MEKYLHALDTALAGVVIMVSIASLERFRAQPK